MNLEKTRVVFIHINEDMADDRIPDESGLRLYAVFLAIPFNRSLLLVVEKDSLAICTTQFYVPVAHRIDRNGIFFLAG